AFSTHYYCIFLALPLSFAIVLAWKSRGWGSVLRHLVIAGVASAATFFLFSPFIVVEPLTAWRDITANREIVVDRAVATGAFRPAWRYLQMLWQDSISPPIVGLGLIGALWMFWKDWPRALLLLLFPLSFFAFITNTVPASRYLNPILPFVALFAAWTLSQAAARFRVATWLFWGAVGLVAIPAAAQSIRADLFIRQADTRSMAQAYVERHFPAGSTVLIQPYSVPVTPSRDGLVEALTRNLGRVEAASAKFQLQLSLDPYPSPSYRLIFLGRGGLDADKIYVDPAELAGADALTPLRRHGVAFVVLKRYNGADSELMPFLAALSHSGTRVAVFTPYRSGISMDRQAQVAPFLHNTDARIDGALQRPGPVVEIWQLNGPRP
ncbi:MAG: hypothetical protein H0W08_19510, partial [Acidobacteria bacterium]|nr:hypothetical protein [Acidobacteriota bacterium]